MTLPVMEPGLTRNNLYEWTNQIDNGPWSSIALGERIVFDNPEFISMLSAVAAWTSNVEIISTVSVLSMHDPVLSAKQFATIDMLSEGRLTVGVGVGGRQEDYEAIGSDWKNHRWKKVSEYSKIMQSIWASEFVQQSHLKRYLAWMGKEIAENLAANAGFCGSIEDLAKLIKQVKECGVDDLLLVPTSKDLKQVIEIEDIL